MLWAIGLAMISCVRRAAGYRQWNANASLLEASSSAGLTSLTLLSMEVDASIHVIQRDYAAAVPGASSGSADDEYRVRCQSSIRAPLISHEALSAPVMTPQAALNRAENMRQKFTVVDASDLHSDETKSNTNWLSWFGSLTKKKKKKQHKVRKETFVWFDQPMKLTREVRTFEAKAKGSKYKTTKDYSFKSTDDARDPAFLSSDDTLKCIVYSLQKAANVQTAEQYKINTDLCKVNSIGSEGGLRTAWNSRESVDCRLRVLVKVVTKNVEKRTVTTLQSQTAKEIGMVHEAIATTFTECSCPDHKNNDECKPLCDKLASLEDTQRMYTKYLRYM